MIRLGDTARVRVGHAVIGVAAIMSVAYLIVAISIDEIGAALEMAFLATVFLTITSISIRSQPRNGAVWALIWAAFFGVTSQLGGMLGVAGTGYSLADIEGSNLPVAPADLGLASSIGISLALWTWVPSVFLSTIHLLVLFPGGQTTSRVWRWTLWVASLAMAVLAMSSFVRNAPWVETPYNQSGDNPLEALVMVLFAIAAAAVVNLVRRYRSSVGEERLQYRWVTWALSLNVAAMFITLVGLPGGNVFSTALLAGIPISFGVAITKYRLYNIDVVVSKSLVYGGLAAVIGGVYVAIVVGLGSVLSDSSLALSITATALVAVIFEPLRVRIQKWANRLVYGDRATPYEVLSDLTGRLAGAETGEGLLERMAERLADGTGAERAVVWLSGSTQLHAAASVPADSTPSDTFEQAADLPGVAVPIEHEGEVLGALSVETTRGDTLTPTELRLIEDLAGSAGLVIRRLRLDEELAKRATELQESRRRLVDAQDVERRRLERDLHDGAQQQVVALKVKLGLARALAEKDSATRTAEVLAQLAADTEVAIDTMRDFARGVYPPLLEAEGLPAAIRAQARRAPIPIEVIDNGIGRHPRQIESTIYFCVLEALQNISKYANASSVTVTLTPTDGAVRFEVVDDGDGFDPATVTRGAGLTNMEDRLGAVNGVLTITSVPGKGTSLVGSTPTAVTVPDKVGSAS
jgi:signal transduction histidine kinase